MFASAEQQRKELWRKKFPAVVDGLLSVFQMFLTLVIVGCEVGGDFINFPRMNVFVGYWTCPLFMCAWISLAGASCCCRIRCCAVTTLVFQCLSIPMALCVIGFDAYFLNNPLQCFFSNDCSSFYNYGYSYYSYSYSTYDTYGLLNTTNLYNIKVPLTKGQLAAGALMLASSVIFIIIFGITSYRVSRAIQFENGPSVPVGFVPPPMTNAFGTPLGGNPGNQVNVNHFVNAPAPAPAPPPYTAPVIPQTNPTAVRNQMICPNCRSRFQIATQHK